MEGVTEGETIREQRLEFILERLGLTREQLKNKKILDVGCGEGTFISELHRQQITTQAYGTDADPEVIAETQKDPYVPTGTFTLANYKDPQPEHVKNCDLIVGHALPIFAVDVIKPENIEKA